MIALVQRVRRAEVEIAGANHATIAGGILALVCAERGDGVNEARALAKKTVELRIFNDVEKRMNRSLIDEGLELLVVPQFTLAADTRSGRRPSFTKACEPQLAQSLFLRYVDAAREHVKCVKTGVFGADMQVALVNDGPVTFWLRVAANEEPVA
jgi:D-tyrosyl-tRNA(Tyr) deacylase